MPLKRVVVVSDPSVKFKSGATKIPPTPKCVCSCCNSKNVIRNSNMWEKDIKHTCLDCKCVKSEPKQK